jgi:hypothetical protein
MPTIACPGGHIVSDGLIPSPNAWRLISDEKLEDALDEIVAMVKAGEDVDARAASVMSAHSHAAYMCPECGRLLVFENGLDRPATSYRRE